MSDNDDDKSESKTNQPEHSSNQPTPSPADSSQKKDSSQQIPPQTRARPAPDKGHAMKSVDIKRLMKLRMALERGYGDLSHLSDPELDMIYQEIMRQVQKEIKPPTSTEE
jgi:hypothetical protein